MIAHLSGTLLSKTPNSVIVDVSGVGYEVNIPVSTFYELEDTGTNVKLRIYTHVKEDALQLFGFKTARERELFINFCLLYTSPSPRDRQKSRMPSSA